MQVLKGLSYPSSSATARANALACRGNIHTELAMDKEAVYDLLEAVKVSSACTLCMLSPFRLLS